MEWTEWVNLLAALVLAGWVSAFVVQLIKRSTWGSGIKFCLSVVVATVIGLATAWTNGTLWGFVDLWGDGMTADSVIVFIVGVFTVAYGWWKVMFSTESWAKAIGAWPKKPT